MQILVCLIQSKTAALLFETNLDFQQKALPSAGHCLLNDYLHLCLSTFLPSFDANQLKLSPIEFVYIH